MPVHTPPELHRLAALSHASTSAGWLLAAAGVGVAIAGHVLGRAYNRARGNQFQSRFHTAGCVVAGGALLFGLFAAGVDALGAAEHAKDARELIAD